MTMIQKSMIMIHWPTIMVHRSDMNDYDPKTNDDDS